MNKRTILSVAIAAGLASVIGMPALASSSQNSVASKLSAPQKAWVNGQKPLPADAHGRVLYMVQLKAPPAAQYHGPQVAKVAGLKKISSVRDADGKLDMQSAAANAYVAHLNQVQHNVLQSLRGQGVQLQVVKQYQYALNAVAAWIKPADASKVTASDAVQSLRRVTTQPLLNSRNLIGAPNVWFGADNASVDTLFIGDFDGQKAGNRGQGVVVGDLDTGINFPNHAFDDDGITNPLGDGNFLGWCNPGFDAAQQDYPAGQTHDACNNKVFGSYDFVYSLVKGVAGITDYPGSIDEQDHGSHTASTMAGDTESVVFQGNQLTLSGVAPEANIVAFDTCYLDDASGQGSCPGVSTANAAEQAIQDGVVDVLNFSIGGGGDPWNNPTSQAFLSATESGIFVAASAGNSGPGLGTTDHLGPWVTTVAASTHDQAGYQWKLVVQGTPQYSMLPGEAGITPTGALPAGTQLILSPTFNAADDGCDAGTAYGAGTFDDGIAVILRGSCAFTEKAANAVAAGAVAVVIANDQGGTQGLAPAGTPQASVPVFGMNQNDGNALAATLSSGPVAGNYTFPALTISETPDKIASFSSRGPGWVNVLKPDITAPGVRILAAYGGGQGGDPDALGLMDGTSMASPHIAGSAALVKHAHPNWTPMEIKSALMLTSKPYGQLLDSDGVTPANVLEAGAGRVQVDDAIQSGLVMRESGLNMRWANPDHGGDPATLNLASLYDNDCAVSCSFQRRVKSTLDSGQKWNLAASIDAPLSVSVPSSFSVAAGSFVPFGVSVDSSAAQIGDAGWYQGQLTLTADGNTATPVLHMPLAVYVPPPTILVAPESLSFTVSADSSDSQDLSVENVGGIELTSSIPAGGSATLPVIEQPSNNQNGYPNTENSADYGDIYEGDDFTLQSPGALAMLSADGFSSDNQGYAAITVESVTFSVFADDGTGLPDGTPDGQVGNAPVYSCQLSKATAGVDGSKGLTIGGGTTGEQFTLDVPTAVSSSLCPASPTLPAGHYWLVVTPKYQTMYPDTWNQFVAAAGTGQGDIAVVYAPDVTTRTNWAPIPDVFTGSDADSLAFAVDKSVACDDGSGWLSVASPTSPLAPETSDDHVTVTVDTTGMTAGEEYQTYACIDSSDPAQPRVVVPVKLTVQ